MQPRQVLTGLSVLLRTGILHPLRPDEYLRMAEIVLRWGTGLAAGSEIAALRAPDRPAVADDTGQLTWRQVDAAANALAHALIRHGARPGSAVGVMCRNSRHFVVGALGVTKAGADLVLLNTEFGAHQLGGVLEREGIAISVHDDEFSAAFAEAGFDGPSFDTADLEAACASSRWHAPAPPRRPGRITVMTSGTTGLPKGAQRASMTPPTDMVVSAFSQLPLRARQAVVVSPPLFHLLGFGFFGFALGLQGTLVVRRKFDPESVLAAVAEHEATTLVAVPVVLQRILTLPEEVRARYAVSSLRLIVCSGSSLSAELANAVMDRFGEILYNFYGSTETGWATVASPADLRAAPGTVGRPPSGTTVAVLDRDDRPVPTGTRGRIFVGSAMAFEGYTGGGGKPVVDGLVSTGDTGYVDEAGRLFVEGRDDEMIVSGGENVFPGEVEELLRGHDAVADAAVVGVDDAEMGQRLVAFVVTTRGASLSAEDVRQYVRSRLARFKVPRSVEFVEEIPRNAMGKVLRRALPEHTAADGARETTG